MWLFTKFGFVSVVEDVVDSNLLLVRARTYRDILLLLAYMPRHLDASDIRETKDADYRYRMFVTRSDFKEALVGIVDGIDYPNFKDAVARTDVPRARLYEKVWRLLRSEIQRTYIKVGDKLTNVVDFMRETRE